MPIYVVISPIPSLGATSLEDAVCSRFHENDRHQVRPGVWLVRSPWVTVDQVRDSLDIKVGGNSGVVIAAGRYTGAADRALANKLQVWEGTT